MRFSWIPVKPTGRQRRLGAELQKLREAAGLKGREAAAALGTGSARLSQIESGIVGMSEDTVRRLAANYVCTDEELPEALVAMATGRTRGWWEKYQGLLPLSFLDIAELEHHATYCFDIEFLHVPGRLSDGGLRPRRLLVPSPRTPGQRPGFARQGRQPGHLSRPAHRHPGTLGNNCVEIAPPLSPSGHTRLKSPGPCHAHLSAEDFCGFRRGTQGRPSTCGRLTATPQGRCIASVVSRFRESRSPMSARGSPDPRRR